MPPHRASNWGVGGAQHPRVLMVSASLFFLLHSQSFGSSYRTLAPGNILWISKVGRIPKDNQVRLIYSKKNVRVRQCSGRRQQKWVSGLQ